MQGTFAMSNLEMMLRDLCQGFILLTLVLTRLLAREFNCIFVNYTISARPPSPFLPSSEQNGD
jgi:hypothetical protein